MATFLTDEVPPELHPKIKTQAHITFYEIKIIKCILYKYYSNKLYDLKFLVCLTK